MGTLVCDCGLKAVVGELSVSVRREAGDVGLEAAGKRVYRVAPPLPGESHCAKNRVQRQTLREMQHKRRRGCRTDSLPLGLQRWPVCGVLCEGP